MEKAELLSWLQQQNQEWEALLAEIGPTRMTLPGVSGEWSMKDIIAHLTDWEQYKVAGIQAAQRGEAEPPPPWSAQLQSDDEVNGWIYERNHGRTLAAITDEMNQTLQQLTTTVEGLPDNVRIDVVEPDFHLVWVGDQRYIIGEFFHHFQDDHEPDVRAWLAKTNP